MNSSNKSFLLLVLQLLVINVLSFFPSSYPYYCSKDIAARSIPVLTATEQSEVTQIQQLQIMMRHGARTPYSLYSCWNDYTVTWNNCNVTTLMLASPSYTSLQRPSPWLFRKLFDGSANYLGGNCLTGQLILEGYLQQEQNGNHLYNAYIDSPINSMKLFNTDVWDEIDTENLIYLRSDNEERTLLSGQVMMHSMFNVTEETIVPWHTGDYNLDQIYPNSNVCPRLNTVAAQAYSTPEFTAENTSDYIETLNQNLTDIFGANMWSWNNVLDCLMTTVCTDRPIPDGSLDAGSIMTDTIFNATVAQSEFMYAFQSLYNNSQWSKLAMGQVSWHIRNNIENMINPPVGVTPYKMAVFSGHDTTIMPFLAAVLGDSWDRRWASYAALISMELYTRSATSTIAGDSDYLVRMVYNGNPLLIPGCDQALCDANVLLEILSFGEESMPCSTTTTTTTIPTDDSCIDSGGLDVVAWSLLVVFLTLAGGIAGVIGTLIATGRFHESTSVVVAKGESNPIHGRSASTGANDSVPLEL